MFELSALTEELLDAARERDGIGQGVLIAGQALAFWGEYYLDDSYPADRRQALSSRDLDLFERRRSRVMKYLEGMREVVVRHGAELTKPHFAMMDEHTINTTIMQLSHPEMEAPLVIEYLSCVGGLDIIRAHLKDLSRFTDEKHQKSYRDRIQLIAKMGRQARVGKALYARYRIDIHQIFEGMDLNHRFIEKTIDPQRARYREWFPD